MASDRDDEILREAIRIVLADAKSSVGSDALAVVFADDELPDELESLTNPHLPGDPFSAVNAYAYVRGEESYRGLWAPPGEPLPEVLVRVAEGLQEVAIESRRFFGRGFPQCPEHPDGEPLWAELVGHEAFWACRNGPTRLRIGSLSR